MWSYSLRGFILLEHLQRFGVMHEHGQLQAPRLLEEP